MKAADLIEFLLHVGLLAYCCKGISADTTGAVKCSDLTMFQCSEDPLECIESHLKCNGVSECANGADESVLACGCLPNEFQCNMTSCIDVIKRCDRNPDCQNGEDEMDCETYACPATHTKCANHYCIPLEDVCNYDDDCGDNSDEENCDYRDCYYTEFACTNRLCLPEGKLCDGVANCRDGSDEQNCDQHFQCENGFYIQRKKVCNGYIDCQETQADETNCTNCAADAYRCANGRCIRRSNMCDGECDCKTTCDDESNCETNACPIGESYICKNSNRCIDKKYLCDGENDCANTQYGMDEYFCRHNASTCDPLTEIWCSEGRCLPATGPDSVICDHYADCLYGEDEQNCDYPACNSSQFQCDNGQCIPLERRCNGGHPDCYDRSDELNCEKYSCPYGTTTCKSGQCIPQEHWCDYVYDCVDFSDETDCVRPRCHGDQFRCSNGQCIDRRYACYNGKKIGREGCMDGSHLLNCRNHTCLPGQFKCTFSYCIDMEDKCDNNIDCKMTYNDEKDCGFYCPNPESVCKCLDVEMHCEDRALQRLPYDLSREDITKFHMARNAINITSSMFDELSKLVYLDLNDNGILHIPDGSFKSLWRLITLKLEDNAIEVISNGTFQGLTYLRTMYLGGNKIREIASYGFIGLSHLHALNLSYQAIKRLHQNTFSGLRNVRTLNLSHNEIGYIEEGAFNGLTSLLTLDLSYNRIGTVKANTFNGLRYLELLDISNNVIDIIEDSVFDGLISLEDLITDEFRFCCAAKMVGNCLPEPDEFSSCTDLMSNYVLRVSIWILGLVAFWGNIVVVVWRSMDMRNGKVHSFLITNLAVGDFFMGAYMMIIAVVDAYYRGSYILYDRFWRESVLCKIAGFLSTFSSELSVLTLTVITLDRLICIIFPLHVRRLKLRDACCVMSVVWLIVVLISAIPLMGIDYFGNFYGRSGVCLAFHITNSKPKGWEYSVGVFLVANFSSFLVIFFSYLRMFFVAKQTRSAVRKIQDKNDSAMARRMTLIVATDFFCWVPIILLGFASLGGARIPTEVFAWVAVFILPLNSAINPVLYTISTAPFLRHFRRRASFFRKSFKFSSKIETKHSFLDRSSHVWDRKPIYRHLELMRMRNMNNTPLTRETQSHSRSTHSHSDNLL
ncbi:G-protein coupled receptor GRL101-like isoform X2 [Mya arenaria]|uniref:G-protein coupled receptor GRL101-like isoform X2 n=1 Tax=Mya arenaria TaxID=6604 RepID=UPI0022DFBFEB|nr:G-protein coupled receptor GRL101-like isoform X2 [Mya arenaria]